LDFFLDGVFEQSYWTSGTRVGCVGQFKLCSHTKATEAELKSSFWKRIPEQNTRGNCLAIEKAGWAFNYFQEKPYNFVPEITFCKSENVFLACQRKKSIKEFIGVTAENYLGRNSIIPSVLGKIKFKNPFNSIRKIDLI